jgi:hypothetical protein
VELAFEERFVEMSQFQYEADCRVNIVEYALKEMDSGAVAIGIRCQIIEWFGTPEGGGDKVWFDWREYGEEVTGDIWIVSGKDKGNKLLEKAIESLVNHAGWDGTLESVSNGTWQPTPCQVSVKKENYKGTDYFKASFVNDYNRTPGALAAGVKPEKAKELQNRFGSQLRAIVGNKMRNQAPPSAGSKPPAPPQAKREVAAAASKPGDDGIPFAWMVGLLTLAGAMQWMI